MSKKFILILVLFANLKAQGQLMENASWIIPPTYKSYQYEQRYLETEKDFPYIYFFNENEILQYSLEDNSKKVHSFTFKDHVIVNEKDFFLIGKIGENIVIYDSKKDKLKETIYQSIHCFYQGSEGTICKGKRENIDTTYYLSLQTESDYFYKTNKSMDYKAIKNRIALTSASENKIRIFDFQGNHISTIEEDIIIKKNYMLSFPNSPFFHFSPKNDFTSEGIISRDGKILAEYYLNGLPTKLIGDHYVVNFGNIFNSKGEKIDGSNFLPTILKKIEVLAYCNNEFSPPIYSIKFLQNNLTIPCDVEDFRIIEDSGLIRIKRKNNDKLKYYTSKGNLLIETDKPVRINKLKEKVYEITQNGYYKIVDDFGNQILPQVFKLSDQGFNGYHKKYLTLFDEEEGLLIYNKKGQQIFQHKDANNLLNIIGGYVIFQDKYYKTRMLPIKNDKLHLPFQFAMIHGGGYFARENDKFLTICDNIDCYLMDTKENKIYPERFKHLLLINKNLLLANQNGYYGILKINF